MEFPVDFPSTNPWFHHIVRRTEDYVDYCSLAKDFRALIMVPHGNVPLGRTNGWVERAEDMAWDRDSYLW